MLSHTAKSRLLYYFVLLVSAGAAIAVASALQFKGATAIIVGLSLLIPGRIAAYLWQDFYLGKRQLGRGEYEVAIGTLQRFRRQVQARPWLKKLMWLSWGFYTRDIEAMTVYNLGIAQMEIGDSDAALESFGEAFRLDGQYLLPLIPLAVLRYARGETEIGRVCLTTAEQLGRLPWPKDELAERAAAWRERVAARRAEKS